jgi:hypothetical protein
MDSAGKVTGAVLHQPGAAVDAKRL